jgi:hypothetical protein
VARLEAAINETGRTRERQRGLGDVVARVRQDRLAEFIALLGRTMRADQHPVAARLADRLDHELIQVVEDIAALLFVPQHIGLDVFQHRVFAQVKPDQRGRIRINRLVVGYARATAFASAMLPRR